MPINKSTNLRIPQKSQQIKYVDVSFRFKNNFTKCGHLCQLRNLYPVLNSQENSESSGPLETQGHALASVTGDEPKEPSRANQLRICIMSVLVASFQLAIQLISYLLLSFNVVILSIYKGTWQ